MSNENVICMGQRKYFLLNYVILLIDYNGTAWMCAVYSIQFLCSEQGFSQAGINNPTGENKSKSCQVFRASCRLEPA